MRADCSSLAPRKFLVPEIVFGNGALALVGRHAANLAARKVLLVTDPGVSVAGWSGKVADSLSDAGLAMCMFEGVTPNPKAHEVMAGVELYAREGCDVIVSVGGGSPMDCAKGIGLVASNGGHILDYEGIDRVAVPAPPLLCVPTTAGTSADVSQFCIIADTERRVKIAIVSRANVPDVALVDPVTTTTMSAGLTAATGMDALVHAFEAYVSTAGSPVTDINALEAIRLVASYLASAIEAPNDLRYRGPMMLASMLAGFAFSNASLGLVHAMAHSLGGWLDSPHGECNALLLEHVVDFNYGAAADRYADIAEAFGLDLRDSPPQRTRASLVGALTAFRLRVGIKARLGDLGVSLGDLGNLSDKAFHDACLVTNPVQPTIKEIEELYERAI